MIDDDTLLYWWWLMRSHPVHITSSWPFSKFCCIFKICRALVANGWFYCCLGEHLVLFCKALNPNGVLKCVDTCCVKKKYVGHQGHARNVFWSSSKERKFGSLSLSSQIASSFTDWLYSLCFCFFGWSFVHYSSRDRESYSLSIWVVLATGQGLLSLTYLHVVCVHTVWRL